VEGVGPVDVRMVKRVAVREICISASEFTSSRNRAFAIGDRIMFRCEWWTVIGVFFAPKAKSLEKMYVLKSRGTEERAEEGRALVWR
jgi:hypothetical protein